MIEHLSRVPEKASSGNSEHQAAQNMLAATDFQLAQYAGARQYDPRTDGQIYYGSGGEYNDFKTSRSDCPQGYIFEDRGFYEGNKKVKNNFCTTPRYYHKGGIPGTVLFKFPIF